MRTRTAVGLAFGIALPFGIVLPPALGIGTAARAAALGERSSETARVSVEKRVQVRITQVDDVFFGFANSAPPQGLRAVENLCIHSDNGRYALTLSSASSPDGRFLMASGDNRLAYGVTLSALGGGASRTLASGEPERGLSDVTPTTGSTDCGGLTNVALALSIAADDFNAAPAGAYVDTLTLFVEPE